MSLMMAGGLGAKRSQRGRKVGVRRNAQAYNTGEAPGVLLERGLGKVGGYDFEGGGGELWSLCEEVGRYLYGRTVW